MATDSRRSCDSFVWAHPDPWYLQGVDRLATGTGLVESFRIGSLSSSSPVEHIVPFVGPERTELQLLQAIDKKWSHHVGSCPRPWRPAANVTLLSAHQLAEAANRAYPAFVGSQVPLMPLALTQGKLVHNKSSITLSRSAAEVLQRVHAILGLAEGWDGEGGRQIDRPSLLRMLTFVGQHLPARIVAPSIVPMSNGGIQIEWHRAGVDVEITFEPGEEDELFFFDLSSKEEWEGSPDEGFRRFPVAELLGRDSPPVS